MIRVLATALALLALAPCTPGPVVPPDPTTPPGPQPQPEPPPRPEPAPSPAATSCARAAARYIELRCGTATAEQFEQQCNNYEALGGAATFNPECQEEAADCAAMSACRGGQ